MDCCEASWIAVVRFRTRDRPDAPPLVGEKGDEWKQTRPVGSRKVQRPSLFSCLATRGIKLTIEPPRDFSVAFQCARCFGSTGRISTIEAVEGGDMAGKTILDKLSIYIPQGKLKELPVERLMRLGEKRDRSVNYLVVQAILEYLKREERKG